MLQEYCTFYIDDFFLGILVSSVQEIVKHQKMTKVPLAPLEVEGLINLRGHIVTAIDLRKRLGIEDIRNENFLTTNIIVKDSHNDKVSLLVDKIGDVITIDDETLEKPPHTLNGEISELILGAYKLKESLLLVLDTFKATNCNFGN